MDNQHDEDADTWSWTAWQARKQASYDADQKAIASGEKTREQVDRDNGAVPAHIAQAPLDWDEILKS